MTSVRRLVSRSLPTREWLVDQLGAAALPSAVELLAGRSAVPMEERGPIVCACFDVGASTLVREIEARSLSTVDAVGAALCAGTNCGSCRPAIQRLISEVRVDEEEVAHG